MGCFVIVVLMVGFLVQKWHMDMKYGSGASGFCRWIAVV